MEGTDIFQSSITIWVLKGNGVDRHMWSRCAMPLQQTNPLPLVQEEGSKWRYHCQPPADSTLQAGPCRWEMFWLPVHHVRGYLPPWPEGLPTLRRGRCQQVILIGVTTCTKCPRPIFPKWEPGWGSKGGSSVPWATLPETVPHPISMALEENQTEEAPLTNPTHPHHLSLPISRIDSCCLLQTQNCWWHLPKMLDLINAKCIKS